MHRKRNSRRRELTALIDGVSYAVTERPGSRAALVIHWLLVAIALAVIVWLAR
jgi:hypothetical protein